MEQENMPQNDNKQKPVGPTSSGIGYGISALVFGILSVLFFYFIIISVLSAILAIIFGYFAIHKGDNGLGKTGLILGIISVLITFCLFLFLQVLDVSLFTIPDWYL